MKVKNNSLLKIAEAFQICKENGITYKSYASLRWEGIKQGFSTKISGHWFFDKSLLLDFIKRKKFIESIVEGKNKDYYSFDQLKEITNICNSSTLSEKMKTLGINMQKLFGRLYVEKKEFDTKYRGNNNG